MTEPDLAQRLKSLERQLEEIRRERDELRERRSALDQQANLYLLREWTIARLEQIIAEGDSVRAAEHAAELADMRREIDAMRSSDSWRSTAPLRTLGQVLRRLLGIRR